MTLLELCLFRREADDRLDHLAALEQQHAGMPRIWNLNAVFGLSSTFSLPIVTLPA